MAEFFCDIEILRNEGEFEARVEGLTPNVMSLKSDNLEELLEPFVDMNNVDAVFGSRMINKNGAIRGGCPFKNKREIKK